MRCPRCAFVGDPLYGMCPQCGFTLERGSQEVANYQPPTPISTVVLASSRESFMKGDVLRSGRYRLLESAVLPKSQRDQGAAWIATDARAARQKVLIRKVEFPEGTSGDRQRIIDGVVKKLSDLARQHQGFPAVVDTFYENNSYYIVLQYPQGESLAALLSKQGGALPEREIVLYGLQLCEMLTVLSNQQPPIVHGGISPETIIVHPDKQNVSLLYIPLFPAKAAQKDDSLAGYLAPEQVRGVLQPASDLYSVAATMHHAVTGLDPRDRLAFFYPPARRLNPVVTPEIEAILAQELRLSIPQRYAYPTEMQQKLANLLVSYPPPSEVAPRNSDRLLIDPAQIRRKSRAVGRRNIGIAAAVSGLVIISFALIYFFPFIANSRSLSNGGVAATATTQVQQKTYKSLLVTEMQAFKKDSIGISDGNIAFDIYQGRYDASLKQGAANALQKGDMSTAVNLLNQAVSADPIDGEALIYNENIHLLQDGSDYVTIVLGLPIGNSDLLLGSARGQLQAAYLAQHEINNKSLLPNKLKLRLLIANSGVNNGNVAKVAQFIANRVVQGGNPDHIVAVVGWPFSSQTINARDIIAGAHLPLISQTASSTKLSGSSPYFFRVNPSDASQGRTLGTLAIKQLKSKKILILRDPTDAYSVSLAESFASQVLGLNGTILKNTFTENKTTVDQYQQIIKDALAQNVDTVFLAGYNVDAIRAAHALGNQSRAFPGDLVAADMKVLGGDGIGLGGVVTGSGNNADAQIARNYPADMQRIIFTSFADFNTWKFLKVPPEQQPDFFDDWHDTFQSSSMESNAPDPDHNTLLIYDAIQVIVYSIEGTSQKLTGDLVRQALAQLGKGKTTPYQGITGRILFDDQGDPIDKAIVVLTIQTEGGGNVIKIQSLIGTFK